MGTSDVYDSNRNLQTPLETAKLNANAFGTIGNMAEPKLDVDVESEADGDEYDVYPPGARLTKQMVERVIELVEKEKQELGAVQRALAPMLHMKQPTLNRLLKKREGVGVDVLLGLRLYFRETGRPMTIDDLLGIGSTDEMVAAYNALEARVNLVIEAIKTLEHSGDVSKKKRQKLLEEAQATRWLIGGNRGRVQKKSAAEGKK